MGLLTATQAPLVHAKGPPAALAGEAPVRLVRAFVPLAWLAASLVILVLMEPLTALPERGLYLFVGAVAAAALATVSLRTREGAWSVSSVYLVVFCVFHFGMTSVIALGLRLPDDIVFAMDHYWPASGAVRHAAVSSLAGLAACVSGIRVVRFLKSSSTKGAEPFDTKEELAIAAVGFTLAVVSIGTWFVKVVAAGGGEVLLASYVVFLERTRDSQLSVLYFTAGLGLVFASTARRNALKTATYVVFILFAIVALPLGLRGEVLFPAFAALSTGAHRSRPSLAKTVVLALFLLVAISWVRELRKHGLRDVGNSAIEASPQAALAELGATIRPVAEVISWAEGGEPFLRGASYWAPIDRALYYLIPGWERPEADEDERLLNVVIQRRVSAIGLSPIAEAYRNFGDGGVVLFMLMLGMVLGGMDSGVQSTRRRLKHGIVLLPLLIFVRNNFTPVPFQVALGFAFFVVALRLAGRRLVRFR